MIHTYCTLSITKSAVFVTYKLFITTLSPTTSTCSDGYGDIVLLFFGGRGWDSFLGFRRSRRRESRKKWGRHAVGKDFFAVRGLFRFQIHWSRFFLRSLRFDCFCAMCTSLTSLYKDHKKPRKKNNVEKRCQRLNRIMGKVFFIKILLFLFVFKATFIFMNWSKSSSGLFTSEQHDQDLRPSWKTWGKTHQSLSAYMHTER